MMNKEHWILDVQFREDEHIARKDHRAANLALVRRMCMNLLRRDEQDKRSMRRKKRFAALDDQGREHFLFGRFSHHTTRLTPPQRSSRERRAN
jgi:hypothetical protein